MLNCIFLFFVTFNLCKKWKKGKEQAKQKKKNNIIKTKENRQIICKNIFFFKFYGKNVNALKLNTAKQNGF